MTINRGTTARKSTQAVEAFIGGAPDGARKGIMRGRKEQITLTVAPELLAKVDEIAGKMGQSRAALISRAISRIGRAGCVTAPEVMNRPRREGWTERSGKGSHRNFTKSGSKPSVIVTDHRGDLKRGLLHSICRAAG